MFQDHPLLTQLKIPNLTDTKKGDILAELTGAICHLHVHPENLPDLIADEIGWVLPTLLLTELSDRRHFHIITSK